MFTQRNKKSVQATGKIYGQCLECVALSFEMFPSEHDIELTHYQVRKKLLRCPICKGEGRGQFEKRIITQLVMCFIPMCLHCGGSGSVEKEYIHMD